MRSPQRSPLSEAPTLKHTLSSHFHHHVVMDAFLNNLKKDMREWNPRRIDE